MNETSGVGFSRREFVSTLAAGAALPVLGASVGRAAEAPSTVGAANATAPRPPTCLHVFSKPLTWLSYEDTARLIAETGFGGIDYSVRPGGHVLPERVKEDLPRAVAAARAAGLKVEMITTGIVRADAPYARDILETAAKLGVKYYRLGWVSYNARQPVWETLTALKPVFRQLAELNRSLGLHGAYQNHAGLHVGAPVWDIYELVRELDPQWIGCQYDIRHATVEGAQSWPLGLRLLQPWIRCVDIKDFRWASERKTAVEGAALGEGAVDFKAYFKLVRELGIAGPMSVHLEYPPFEGGPQLAPAERRKAFATAMRKDSDTLKAMMAAAGLV